MDFTNPNTINQLAQNMMIRPNTNTNTNTNTNKKVNATNLAQPKPILKNANANANAMQQNLPRNDNVKKISYDDILNSMSLRVNNGKLELVKKQDPAALQKQQPMQQKQYYPAPNAGNVGSGSGVGGNNYIYNKYFQDFKTQLDQKEEEEKLRKMTPGEYRREMIKRYLKQEYDRQMMRQVKSKKLQFHTGNINIANARNQHTPAANANANNGLNKLFRLMGK
jgi:hypothetical protein